MAFNHVGDKVHRTLLRFPAVRESGNMCAFLGLLAGVVFAACLILCLPEALACQRLNTSP